MTESASDMPKTAGAVNAEPPFWAATVYYWALAHLPKSRGGRIALAVGFFCIIGTIVLSLILVPLLGDDVDEGRFEAFGYVGIFVASLAGTSFIVFPLPGMSAVSQGLIIQQGAVYSPLIVGLVGGTGMAIGEAGSYIAGAVGSEASRQSGLRLPGRLRAVFDRISGWVTWLMTHYGMLTLFTLSAIPNPIIDVAGAIAGAARMPFWRFFGAQWAGKTVRALSLAYLGAYFF